MGLLSHYLIGGIVMPLRLPENTMNKLNQYQICNFIRLGRSTGFLLGAYLVFTSAAMLWQVQQPILLCCECFIALIVPCNCITQVCAALAICHILPSPPSGTALGSDRSAVYSPHALCSVVLTPHLQVLAEVGSLVGFLPCCLPPCADHVRGNPPRFWQEQGRLQTLRLCYVILYST